MNKTVKIIMDVILILIIVLLSIYAILRFTNKVEIFKVKTGSMETNIHTGDYVLILKNTNYGVGDVITFKSNGQLITHRIVEIQDDKVITKGDANNAEDDAIPKSSIVGKVILNGGILNFIINFKYAIICTLLSIYLLTCYFGSGKKES